MNYYYGNISLIINFNIMTDNNESEWGNNIIKNIEILFLSTQLYTTSEP